MLTAYHFHSIDSFQSFHECIFHLKKIIHIFLRYCCTMLTPKIVYQFKTSNRIVLMEIMVYSICRMLSIGVTLGSIVFTIRKLFVATIQRENFEILRFPAFYFLESQIRELNLSYTHSLTPCQFQISILTHFKLYSLEHDGHIPYL